MAREGVDYTAAKQATSRVVPAIASSMVLVDGYEVEIAPLADGVYDNGEWVDFALIPLGNQSVVPSSNGRPVSVTLPITDTGTPPQPQISIIPPDPNASELTTSSGMYCILRNDVNLAQTLTFNYAFDPAGLTDPATYYDDYTASSKVGGIYPSGSLTFPAGVAMIEVKLTPVDDSKLENDELAQLKLLSGSAYDVDVTKSKALILIVDKTLPSSIGDTVWIDANGNSVQDNGELGMPDVVVKLYKSETPTVVFQTTNTDFNGHYQFDKLSSKSEYLVEFANPVLAIYHFTTASTFGPIALQPDEHNNTIDAGLRGFGTVSGVVFDDRGQEEINGDGLQNDGAPNIAGVTVKLFDAQGVQFGEQISGESGSYLFNDVPFGGYKVKFIHDCDCCEIFTLKDAGPDDIDSDVNDEGWTDPFEIGISKNPFLETAKEKQKADAGLAKKYKLVLPAPADLANLTKDIKYKWVEIKNIANVVGFIKYKGAAVIHFDDTVSADKAKKDLFFAQEVEAQIPRCLFPEFANLGAVATKNPPGRVNNMLQGAAKIVYDREHLIRRSWGGIDDLRNIVSMLSSVNQGGGSYFVVETKIVNTINAIPKPLDYITFKSTPVYVQNTKNFFGKTASIADLFGTSNITGVQVCQDGNFHIDKNKIRPVGFDVIASEILNNGQPTKIIDLVGNNATPQNADVRYFGPQIQNP